MTERRPLEGQVPPGRNMGRKTTGDQISWRTVVTGRPRRPGSLLRGGKSTGRPPRSLGATRGNTRRQEDHPGGEEPGNRDLEDHRGRGRLELCDGRAPGSQGGWGGQPVEDLRPGEGYQGNHGACGEDRRARGNIRGEETVTEDHQRQGRGYQGQPGGKERPGQGRNWERPRRKTAGQGGGSWGQPRQRAPGSQEAPSGETAHLTGRPPQG